MRYIFEIGHPAHVHNFKYVIKRLKENGNTIKIVTSDKDVTLDLLNAYGLEYDLIYTNTSRGLLNKLLMIVSGNINLYRISRRFDPDVFVSRGSPISSFVRFALRKKHIVLEDTEHAFFEHMLAFRFADSILTPSCYKKDLRHKQFYFNGFKELMYLHPDYFRPDPGVLTRLGMDESSRFIIVRFVSWNANHDIGHHGISDKRDFIRQLEQYGRVFISSEGRLDEELKPYELRLPPEKIHDLMYYSSMYIGEGATMATEAAIMGVPSIYVSSLAGTMGNFDELEKKYDLLYMFKEPGKALEKALELLRADGIRDEWKRKRDILLNDKINVTEFMTWFIQEYPDSFRQVKSRSSIQDRFKGKAVACKETSGGGTLCH